MSRVPNVFVASFANWHAYRLARQMHRLGALRKLYTAHPLPIRGLPSSSVINMRFLGCAREFLERTGLGSSAWAGTAFDRQVSFALRRRGRLGRVVVDGFAGYCLESLRVAKECGAVTCLERSSAHVAFQRKLAWEECDRQGIPHSRIFFQQYEIMLEEYRVADRIVVPSQFVARSFVANGIHPSRLLVVPLGVDIELFTAKPPAHENGPFRVLFVGGSTVEKGIGYLLQAWNKLDLPNGELWIVSPACRPPGYTGLCRKVRWWRYLPQTELKQLYWKASLFCLPSVQDGFGMVVLEAMACGLPVIVTEHVGAADCVREGTDGFIVPIRDPGAIADKLLLLYENRERRREMGWAARQQSMRFSWETYGESMIRSFTAFHGG